MGNISRVLLNLFKILIFVMFKQLLSPPNVHAVNISSQITLLLALTFVPLPYLFG